MEPLTIPCVADIIKESITSYTDNDENSFKTIVAFDCRGVEPTDFSPRVTVRKQTHHLAPAQRWTNFKNITFLEASRNLEKNGEMKFCFTISDRMVSGSC